MKLIITKNYEELSKVAAEEFAKVINEKPNAVLGLATGGSPVGMYKELIAKCKNNELDFTRIMRNGGNDIDNALSQRLEISKKLVESMKIEKADLTSILENDEINDVIKEVISEWLSDLSRIIQFYKNKQRGNDIHKIYIYGGTSNIKGLEKAIEAKLNIKTEKRPNSQLTC